MTETMPVLERRRIEAGFAKAIFGEMFAAFGEETARRVLGEAVRKQAIASAQAMAASCGANDLTTFRESRAQWTAGGALEISEQKATDTAWEYTVTRCRYAEMYREMGIAHLGALLSCNRDHVYGAAFNPELELTQTQTIMGGAPCCDFQYRMKGTE